MPDYPQRRSPRQKGYDYSRQGIYFLTSCTFQRACLFGDVKDNVMEFNAAGEMVQYWWYEIAQRFPEAILDAFVVMPNHVHGLICIESPNSQSISNMMHWFKTMTTNAYIRGVKQSNWPPFERQVWQTSFHDKRVQTVQELTIYRQYIKNNPQNWREDTFYAGD